MIKIKLNPNNTNKHTDEGMKLLEHSIDKVGVIESISVAEDGTIISGHARKEIFDKKGLVPKEIELADNEFAVIKTKIKPKSKEYYEAQILANTTAHKNYNLDTSLIEEISVEHNIDIEELGVEVVQIDSKGKILKQNLKPFIKTHILLSFPPEKMIDIQEYIEKILQIDGVEYEQSSN